MKLDRLLAIVILLLNRKRISASELAAHFEVAPRTIYRDLEAINQAGIPIVAHQGSGGGYAIMEEYRLDRQVMTTLELQTIMTALKGVNTTMEDRQIDAMLEKMQTVIDKGESSGEGNPQVPVYIDFSSWESRKSEKDYLYRIRTAIADRQVISFHYTNAAGGGSRRTVEPMGLFFKSHAWYLTAFCRLKNEFRHFKLSRMRELAFEDETYIPKPWSPENPNAFGAITEGRACQNLVMRFFPHARVRVEDFFDADNIIYESDGSLLVNISYPEDEWLYGFILSFGDDVELLEPMHIREIIKEKAEAIVRKYERE